MHPTLESFELTGPVARTSTAAEVAAAAEVLGLPVPPSFVEYATTLGSGTFFRQVGMILYPPLDGVPDSLGVRAPGLHEFFLECWDAQLWELDPDGTPELIARLVPFGISEIGHWFAWDPEDPSGEDELWIYAIGSKMLSVTKAAPDLFELLESCCDDRITRIIGNLPPQPRVFTPWVPVP